ncbi:MAG TPA: glycine betaine/L-proline ABC transporter ATP-binding protein [Rhodanobacteraceae bacterium]|jgi:glycine betaine/proline transport system ATP-binding protein|nr:glycine betaine/L-proline ABC transporter ATP-binding protein [Rhodanobacteraceae bacterium]
MPKIRVENVTKIFGKRPQHALRMLDAGKSNQELRADGHAVGCANVSFEAEEGELLVVMGLSGSGKSTLIRCLNLLNSVTRGHIYVDGEDITRFDRAQLLEYRRRKISMVFQHFALFPYRTVTDNAAYGLEIQGMARDERRTRAREALQLVGLKGWEDAYPRQLSGGMQQRVGLARALAVQSDILLMDEAFSALDPLIRRDMQHELVQLQQKMHKTIVFITHDLDEALQLGDRIVLMKDGLVVQFDTPEAILDNPANAYVERFVEHVDLSRVLTARAALTRARVVAFEKDGPRTVLHKMNEENYTSIVVVKRDYTFLGTVSLDAAEQAAKQGARTITACIEKTPSIGPDTPLTGVINELAGWPYSLPVVDPERGELLGVVTRTGVLTVLADSTPNSLPAVLPPTATPAPVTSEVP